MNADLIVALDVPRCELISPILSVLPPRVTMFKVGLELFAGEGPKPIAILTQHGKKVFLDLKLHDIPRTVARAVASAAAHGVDLLTVHASGGRDMLTAAAEAASRQGASRPKLLAVTTLTSLNEKDLREIGVTRNLQEHTLELGALAVSAGIDGLVCSPLEARAFRERLGDKPILVTPGVRPAGSNAGDQKRIATPRDAVMAGANYIVVGRPILDAPDPRAAAETILREIQ